MNPMDLRTGINIGVDKVIKHLLETSQIITTPQDIASVATVSSNNDLELGAIVGHLF
jgi:chaperonin GroEL